MDQLKHPKDVQFAVSRDMKIVVTVAEDCNVRIWDRSRPKMNEANQRDGRKIDLYYIQQQPYDYFFFSITLLLHDYLIHNELLKRVG